MSSTASSDVVGLRVWASGWTRRATGIGVFQAELYGRLERNGIDLRLGPPRADDYSRRPAASVRSFARQYLTTVQGDVALVVVSPAPRRLHIPVVGVVHDLRWMRTRGGLSRAYRLRDLTHLVRRSSQVVCISERTRSDLLALFPDVAPIASVVYHGPGQVPLHAFRRGEIGTMLLMGNASHKRNDLAALALSTARLSWLRRIIGVNLAMPVRTTLESRFGAANCEWHENVSTAEIVRLYSRAQVFMSLSMEEGFGLPYVEALSAGCVVIGIRQAVTVEILSHAAVLLDDGGVTAISEQLEALNPSEWPSEQVRRERAAEFSWDAAAATMLSVLRSACDR